MTATRRIVRLAVPAVSALAAGCFDAVTGGCAGAAHLLPFALVAIPLLAGRYLGEDCLARLARTRRARRRPRRQTAPQAPGRRAMAAVPRGGRLIASYLAVRPPPGGAATTA